MTTRATPAHKQPARLQTIAEVMAQDAVKARNAYVYFEYLQNKERYQKEELKKNSESS